MLYTQVGFVEERIQGKDILHKVVLRSDGEARTPEGEPLHWIHEIPVQALGNRIEVFGLTDNEQALEFIGRGVRDPEAEDFAGRTVYPEYTRFVQAECRAVLEGAQPLPRGPQPRTLMAVDNAVPALPTENLDKARTFAKERVRLSTTERGRTMLSSFSTPVSSPAAVALNCTEDVLQQILLASDKAADIIEAFRLDTVFNAAPFFQQALVDGPTTS
jgi:hypothetical protein